MIELGLLVYSQAGSHAEVNFHNAFLSSSRCASNAFNFLLAAMVGKLIGKGGETIKHLQLSTGSRVQIDHQTPGDTKRVIHLQFGKNGLDPKEEYERLPIVTRHDYCCMRADLYV